MVSDLEFFSHVLFFNTYTYPSHSAATPHVSTFSEKRKNILLSAFDTFLFLDISVRFVYYSAQIRKANLHFY
jgi:hypothetical protein